MQFPNVSPEIFSVTLFGMTFALRWYAKAYIVGLLIGWRLIVAAVKRPQLFRGPAPMTPAQVEDLLTWIILGVILGGRLGYVLFYQPGYFAAHPGDIIKVWHGGMAFHGGLIGVMIAVWACARKYGAPLGEVADLLAIATPPALLLGRLANFVNAELWGRPTDLPWGIIFPGEDALCTDGLPCPRHPSQLYEAGLEGLLLGALLLWLAFGCGWLKKRWQLTGVFFAGYGLSRFVVEFMRQPDAQFQEQGNPLGLALHIQGYGLTMGQILSLPMIAFGFWLIWRK